MVSISPEAFISTSSGSSPGSSAVTITSLSLSLISAAGNQGPSSICPNRSGSSINRSQRFPLFLRSARLRYLGLGMIAVILFLLLHSVFPLSFTVQRVFFSQPCLSQAVFTPRISPDCSRAFLYLPCRVPHWQLSAGRPSWGQNR